MVAIREIIYNLLCSRRAIETSKHTNKHTETEQLVCKELSQSTNVTDWNVALNALEVKSALLELYANALCCAPCNSIDINSNITSSNRAKNHSSGLNYLCDVIKKKKKNSIGPWSRENKSTFFLLVLLLLVAHTENELFAYMRASKHRRRKWIRDEEGWRVNDVIVDVISW